MIIEKGMYFKTTTTTKDDVFGECIWKVVKDGMVPPEKGRQDEKDGVKCILVGGSGPAARPGYSVIDSSWKINLDIQNNITEIISTQDGERFEAHYSNPENEGKSAGGGIEVDY